MKHPINKLSIVEVAAGLKELNDKMYYVGGSVLEFYVDDAAAAEARPTDDIDMTVELTTYSEWGNLQDSLNQLGFVPDMSSMVICRFLYKGITVDIMPTDDIHLGGSNKWYKIAIPFAYKMQIANNVNINLFPLPYVLAAKFEAFNSRGKDYRTSHDFEDIIYLVNNCKEIITEVVNAEPLAQKYLVEQFSKFLGNPHHEEYTSCHLPYESSGRLTFVLNKIHQITII